MYSTCGKWHLVLKYVLDFNVLKHTVATIYCTVVRIPLYLAFLGSGKRLKGETGHKRRYAFDKFR